MHGGLPTPVVTVRLLVDGIPRTLWLKLEAYNLYGSIKGRTAAALWQDVAPRIDGHIGFIESSSGNLGLALAAIAAAHRVPFTAVVDPHISRFLLRDIRALGARVVSVDTPDSAGGYLLNRLEYVRDQLEREPRLVWTDQYTNPANPAAHSRWTAPELHRQTAGAQMSVLVAVSTGGTLAGFRAYASATGAPWELVGVDVTGSAALGGVPGRRVLSGIGASRASAFLPNGHDPTMYVTAEEAVNTCLWLDERTGIGIGSSSGALVASALRLFHADPERASVACLCPDGADRYSDTVYSRDWRHGQGIFETGIGSGVNVLAPPSVQAAPAAGDPALGDQGNTRGSP